MNVLPPWMPRASLRLGSACVHNTVVAIIHFYITLFLYKFGSLTGACAGVPRGPRSPRAQGCVLGPIPSGLATLYILYRPIRLLSPFKCQHTTEALRWIENVPNCSGHGTHGYITIGTKSQVGPSLWVTEVLCCVWQLVLYRSIF